MIGKIKGIVSEIDGNIALVETASGLFYNVFLTNALLSECMSGDKMEVYTYHHIREDVQSLFGFQNKQEYKLFLLLINVSGVGPKSAYSIISNSKVDEIVAAVRSNDAKYFTRIPGLGKKTALKIMLELSQKFKSEFVLENNYVSKEDQTIVDALTSLGFGATEAKEILPKLSDELSVEEQIKEAIRLLSNPN
ncbi:Holliday junction branch migration protein RuvA [Candidatus Roizmanbacteria bacterium]|nr:MAG: Holliday junction branch migration protein RuvA [Candidatus Roizmanbacteria bacterium]